MNNWCICCSRGDKIDTECCHCISGKNDVTAPSKFVPVKDCVTNRDWINSLDDRELAKYLSGRKGHCCYIDTKDHVCIGDCVICWINWLKSIYGDE